MARLVRILAVFGPDRTVSTVGAALSLTHFGTSRIPPCRTSRSRASTLFRSGIMAVPPFRCFEDRREARSTLDVRELPQIVDVHVNSVRFLATGAIE